VAAEAAAAPAAAPAEEPAGAYGAAESLKSNGGAPSGRADNEEVPGEHARAADTGEEDEGGDDGALREVGPPLEESAMHWLCVYLGPYTNKGSVSNTITFCTMLVGIALKAVADAGADAPGCTPGAREARGGGAASWVLAMGLFGFAGGITNWLAVQMLFDRVCGLPGSGVIPRRFREIRQVVKDTIMRTFFDGPYLQQYMDAKMESLTASADLGPKLAAVLESPEVDKILDEQVTPPRPARTPAPTRARADASARRSSRRSQRGRRESCS